MAQRIELTDSEYHARPEMSKSRLWEFATDPHQFMRYERGLDQRPKPTESMIWGRDFESVYFTGALDNVTVAPAWWESVSFPRDPAAARRNWERAKIIPDSVLNGQGHRKGGKWEKYRDDPAHESLVLLTGKEYRELERQIEKLDLAKSVPESTRFMSQTAHGERSAEILEAVNRVRECPKAVELLDGEHHVPILWEHLGVQFKSQLDIVKAGDCIVDLKTCRDVRPLAFSRQSKDLGYSVQAWCYQLAWYSVSGELLPVRFVAVKNTPSYAVQCYQFSDDFIRLGELKGEAIIRHFIECRDSNDWELQDHGELIELDPPAFALKQLNEWEAPIV